MTPREGFKYGFLLRCAEEGLTVKEAEARAWRFVEKRADGWGSIASDIYNNAKGLVTGIPGVVGNLGLKGVGIGLGGAAVAGGLGGYGLAKMQEKDIDPEEVQREELIAAYQAQADLARRKMIMDAAKRTLPRPKSFHGI